MSVGKQRYRKGLRSASLLALTLTVLAGATPDVAPVADAAQRSDANAVRALLQQGADPNAAQADGLTGLHWAALNDQLEIAQLLLYAGATVKPVTRVGGYTPLHLASRAGHDAIVRALLEAGAEPDRFTTTGVTALHFAAEADAAGAVDALTEHGANVDAGDSFSNRTPLMFASVRNAPKAMQALVNAGADLSATTAVKNYVEIAEADTAEREQRARVRKAAEEPDPDAEEDEPRGGQQSRSAPAEEPTEPKLPKLLSSTEQIGLQGGFTALHFAAREGHDKAARLLVDAGADVNQVTAGDESSPMLVAVINGNYDLAKDLLEAGADPNLVSDDGAGPLFATLNIEWSLRTWYPQPQAFRQQETSYLDLMELLLEAGAETNARVTTHIWYAAYNAGRMGVDFAGATPFWRAAYAADVKAMKMLVANGADPNIWTYNLPRPRRVDPDVPTNPANNEPEPTDPSGLPPVPHGGPGTHALHAASGVGFGSSRVAQTHRHVPEGWLPAVKYLLEELGIDPNLRDKDGYTALHNSAARGDNETILYLLSQGADINVISRRGQTTADLANSPEQRAQPHPAAIALLEKFGSENNHQCRSCGGASR